MGISEASPCSYSFHEIVSFSLLEVVSLEDGHDDGAEPGGSVGLWARGIPCDLPSLRLTHLWTFGLFD